MWGYSCGTLQVSTRICNLLEYAVLGLGLDPDLNKILKILFTLLNLINSQESSLEL